MLPEGAFDEAQSVNRPKKNVTVSAMNAVRTEPIEDLQTIKGFDFPAQLRFRQLLVTGPPGCGKSTLTRRIGGWSEEGFIDLSIPKWWTAQSLSMRPREIHLGIPCAGYERGLAVYDAEWVDPPTPPALELERIKIPPAKRHFFSVDWCSRYVFEFLLTPPRIIYEWRSKRARRGTHHVDAAISLALIEKQVETMRLVALHLRRNGLSVYIREGVDGGLQRFVDTTD